MASTPLAANFDTTQGSGTPINIDGSTGKAYYLSSSNVVIPFTGELIDIEFFGGVADDATDCRAACIAGIAFLSARGGGTLRFSGKYFISGSVALAHNITILGDGKASTVIRSTHAGTGVLRAGVQSGAIFYNEDPINSSTVVNVNIKDLRLENSNGANIGAGYYNQAGTYITLENVEIRGFKYGLVLHQSELVDYDLCIFQQQLVAGVWLSNGPDLDVTAAGGFTNRISSARSQFNESAGVYGIVDDGGTAHSYTDNNYNGCLNHIRAAGVLSLLLNGGEFESAASHCIVLTSTVLSGGGTGGSFVSVRGGLYAATAGHASINCAAGAGQLDVDGEVTFTGGGGTNPITGANNLFAYKEGLVANLTAGSVTDFQATNHYIKLAVGDRGDVVVSLLGGFVVESANPASGTFPVTGNITVSGTGKDVGTHYIDGGTGTARFLQWQTSGVNSAYTALGGDDVTLFYNVLAGGTHTFQVNSVIIQTVSNTGVAVVGVITATGTVSGTAFKVGGLQIVGAQGAPVADSAAFTSVNGTNAAANPPTQAEFNALVAEFNKLRTDTLAIRTQLNLALARLRAATGHGLIA